MRPAVLLLALPLLTGCWRSHTLGVDAAIDGAAADAAAPDAAAAPASSMLWVLVHPSDAPRGAGVYLFDEARQEIVRQLPLPPGVMSPHGLAWDGASIWLSDWSGTPDPAIYQLDPEDGSVISRLSGIAAEGIAVDGDTLWYAGQRAGDGTLRLVHITREGASLSSVGIAEPVVQDLAIADGVLYYLINDDLDRIVRIDPSTGSTIDVVRGVDTAPYALGFDGRHLAMGAWGALRRYDRTTGALIRESALAVPGWITAIAFVRL